MLENIINAHVVISMNSQWTKQKPTEDGFYWVKEKPDYIPYPCEINGDEIWITSSTTWWCYEDLNDPEFLGPIKPEHFLE